MSDTSSLAMFHCAEVALAAGRSKETLAPCHHGELLCAGCPNAKPLTAELEGLVSVEQAVRPAAFLVDRSGTRTPVGSTHAWGAPDVPVDAPWKNRALSWEQSPYDGESLCIQLNLEEVPAAVRQPQWPATGVLWVTLDLSDSWEVRTYFDPRPASSIAWEPRTQPSRAKAVAPQWTLANVWAPAIGAAYPSLVGNEYLLDAMDEWLLEHELYWPSAQGVSRTALQVGGWVWPCQGDAEDRNADFVCGLFRQEFGDLGEVSVHYTPEKGFFGYVDTH